MSRALRLCAIVVISACVLFAQKSNKPDFSGTWQLDLQRTRFGNVPPPKNMVIQFEHHEPRVRIVVVTTTEKGEQREILELTTDGTQHACVEQGQPCSASASWDQWTGTRLVVEVKRADNTRSRRFTLGKLRKILTTVFTVTDSSGEKKAYEFFYRQGG